MSSKLSRLTHHRPTRRSRLLRKCLHPIHGSCSDSHRLGVEATFDSGLALCYTPKMSTLNLRRRDARTYVVRKESAGIQLDPLGRKLAVPSKRGQLLLTSAKDSHPVDLEEECTPLLVNQLILNYYCTTEPKLLHPFVEHLALLLVTRISVRSSATEKAMLPPHR